MRGKDSESNLKLSRYLAFQKLVQGGARTPLPVPGSDFSAAVLPDLAVFG
jgi:hypothetical protein